MKIRKVHLIYPDSRRFTSNFSTNRFPYLATAHAGLPILGEILLREGYDVRIFDEKISPVSEKILHDCDFLGISIQAIASRQGYRLAERAKVKNIPVCFGGVHATLNPDEALTHGDYVVRNEGEETLPALLSALNEDEPLSEIRGLSYWESGQKKHNPMRPLLKNLDTVPFPNWELLDGFQNPLLNPLNDLIYFTQATRGCPFLCNFCSITQTFGLALRARSVDNVIEELKTQQKRSQGILFFHDDSIAANKTYLKTLLEAMLRKKCVPEFGWHSQMRCDIAGDKELLNLMKRSNCIAATFGFESINPETLKYMKKGQTTETIKRCIKAMHERDIFVIGFFVLGSDEDDVKTIHDTCDFAKREGVDFAGFMPMTPFPGTPFYEEMDKQGRIFSKDWELYDVEHVVYFPKKMTPYELYTETIKCYDKFYTPALTWKRYAKIFRRNLSLFGLAAGFYWPVFKRYSYQKEMFSNRDYLKALHDVSAKKTKSFPVLSTRNLWQQDILSGRVLRPLLKGAADAPFKLSGGLLSAFGLPSSRQLRKIESKLRSLEQHSTHSF